MSKLILEFTLPEEQEEAALAQKAGLYSSILSDIENYVRSLRKYDDRETIPTEEVVEKLHELLMEYER